MENLGRSLSDIDNDLLNKYGITGESDSAKFEHRKTIGEKITKIVEKVGITRKQKWKNILKTWTK